MDYIVEFKLKGNLLISVLLYIKTNQSPEMGHRLGRWKWELQKIRNLQGSIASKRSEYLLKNRSSVMEYTEDVTRGSYTSSENLRTTSKHEY